MPNSLACLVRSGRLTGLLLLLANTAPAVGTSTAWLEWDWQSGDGLPDNVVSGVAQTPDGYLWAATEGGLMRFDGQRFQELPLVNLEGVANRVVRALVLDRRGRLWLGMDRGPVVCIEPGAARVFSANNGLPDARASSMAEDAEGAVWIAYGAGNASRIKDGQVALFGAREGLPFSVGSWWLASDAKDQLWFAKGGNVGVFRNGRFQTLVTLPERAVCIGKARAGGMWICAGLRLLRFEEGADPVERANLPYRPAGNDPWALLEDRSGAVWIGTAANGLFRYDGSKLRPVPASHTEIKCLTEDREGDIWVGTGGGGLDRLRPRTVELLGTDTGLPFESVRSVCEDVSGAIWVTTQNGLLARWQGAAWTTVSEQADWPGGHPTCVAADPQGGVWVGTHDRGLYHWHDGQCHIWREQDGLASDNVRSLLYSSAGDLWVATDSPSRLQRLHQGELRSLNLPSRSRSLRAMAEDIAGNIWVGTAEGQLWRFKGDTVENETLKTSTRPQSIRCLYATPDGSLWIGYAGWGLGRYKAGHCDHITSEQGLYDNYVSQIVADDHGWLWLAGNRGLFQVSLRDLAAVAENQAERVRSIVYGRGEGLQNLEPNYDSVPGATRGRDGRLWLPTRTGLAVIHAEGARLNPAPPPVLLERVAVDGQAVALYDSHSPLSGQGHAALTDLRTANAVLDLRPSHRKLEIEFTALSFTAPENVHFRYRLEGFDQDWVEAGTRRNASYPRLGAGRYRFWVKACNNAGVWNEAGATLGLTVTPFFWQTAWFRFSALGGFTLAVIALVRYVSFRRLRLQLRSLEQQAALYKERARIAKDIHDDLGANLTQISLLSELTRQDMAAPDKAGEHLQKISGTARQVMKSLDEIVWAVNPRNDTLAHLIDYAGQFALDYLRLAGIRCRLDLPEQPPQREVSTDVRHNLFLAAKEALHNIVKHAHASEAWLRVNPTEDALEMIIEDNGRGFDRAPDDATADGLRNMRQRLAELGGQCRIQSRSGAGTKVILHLPWPSS